MKERIYLDNAATTKIDPLVVAEMTKSIEEIFGNPSSIHGDGRKAKVEIEKARKKIAELLNTSPSEIFFTSGGTEADNMALVSSVESLGIEQIISTKIEHHAVLHTIEHIKESKNISVEFLNLNEKGEVDYEQLRKVLENGKKSLVSLMHANNEIGNFNDLSHINSICQEYNAVFHSDTVQTMGHYPMDLKNLDIDFIVGAAHKFYGPKGVGFLYINSKNKIGSLLKGGSQERNMRGGTENLYGIIGMAKALEVAYEQMEENKIHVRALKEYMIKNLTESIPGVQFNGKSGDVNNSLYSVLNISFPENKKNDMLLFNFDIEGISCSGGSACSSGTDIGSHVLKELKVPSEREHVRFSFGKYNTKSEIDKVISTLKKIL